MDDYGEVGEWMRGLGLGITNPVRTGEMLDVYLCLGVGGEWLRGLDQGLEEWGDVMSVYNVSLDSLCR